MNERTRKRTSARSPRRSSQRPRAPSTKARRREGRPWLSAIAAALLATALLVTGGLWWWARTPGEGTGRRVVLEVHAGASVDAVADELARKELVSSARLFRWYWRWSGGGPLPGQHLLRDDLSARELVQRLARLPGRPRQRLTFPEGFTHLQRAERLEEQEICLAAAFRRAASDPALLAELGVRGPNVEGRLFPATYELFVNSDPAQVIRLLVGETRKRLGKLESARSAQFAELEARFGWTEHEILTLASIVEKEAAGAEELPLVASVFMNRLTDQTFRPLRMLQSDPTAAYGCLVAAERAPSCAAYRGQVTPAMLRDAANPYNTYKRAGLPPGPIANPGERAIVAVLDPAKTDYLYFFARGGKHTFTRTFAEHREAIDGQKRSQ